MTSQSMRGIYVCSSGYIGKKGRGIRNVFVFMSWTENVRIKINP